MASKGELMRSGLAAEVANCLGQDLDSTSETATGSAQTDAFQIKAAMTIFGTVGSGTGAILPSATGNGIYTIMNNGSNALALYPAVGQTINASTANTSFSVTNGKAAICVPHLTTWHVILSA